MTIMRPTVPHVKRSAKVEFFDECIDTIVSRIFQEYIRFQGDVNFRSRGVYIATVRHVAAEIGPGEGSLAAGELGH